MKRHFRRNDITKEHMKIEVLTGSFKGAAKTWFCSLGDLDCDFDDLEDICERLIKRFGKTEMQKLKEFSNLKPKSGESHQAYADRIRSTSLGLTKSEQELIEKYLSTIPQSAAVYDHVISQRPLDLQEAVAAVEIHSKTSPSSKASGDRPAIRCSICKRVGHTAKTCRSKAAKNS